MQNFLKNIREKFGNHAIGRSIRRSHSNMEESVIHREDRKLQSDSVSVLEEKYPVGTRIEGTVVEFRRYGAIVEFGGMFPGLLHNSEISWGDRHVKASDCFRIGDTLSLFVININKGNRRLELSYRAVNAHDPWRDIEQTHPVGTRISGCVTRFVPYGAFVRVDNGIAALLHKTNIPASCALEVGKVLDVTVISVDSSARKMGVAIDTQ